MSPRAISIGVFELAPRGQTVAVEGQTSSGVQSTGTGTLYDLIGPDGLHLTLRDTTWQTSERDVVACDRHHSPARFDTLVERLRLTVQDYGGPYLELRQARLRENGRAGLFTANAADLDHGAGVDVQAMLLAQGALAVGTRAALNGDTGPARNRLGVHLGPAATGPLAAIAYVLTRVAPIANGLAA